MIYYIYLYLPTYGTAQHLLANFPQVKCLLNRVTSVSKEYWQLQPWEVTSTRSGETWHNLFWVQQPVMSGKQSTRTHLLMSAQLATQIFLDWRPKLTHNMLEIAYIYYKIQHVTWWNAYTSNSQKSRTSYHEILNICGRMFENPTWWHMLEFSV